MSRLRVALLGCGDVAQRDYLPEWHRIADRAELVAVCGRTHARAAAVARQYGAPQVFADAARMLAEGGAQVVLNLTPIGQHDALNYAVIEAGLHLYSEKPFASSAAVAHDLAALAAARGAVVVAAPSLLRFPQLLAARVLLADGTLGLVHSARGLGFGGIPPWGGYPSDPRPFFATSGGVLRDMGVYPLHAITGLLGPARRVSAFATRSRTSFTVADGPFAGQTVPIEAPDTWQIGLELVSGCLATVEANNSTHTSAAPQLELMGTDATLAIDLLDVQAPLRLARRGGAWQEIAVAAGRPNGGPDHILGVAHLLECIASGAAPELSIAHAAHVLGIIDAAYASASDGRAHVVVPPTMIG